MKTNKQKMVEEELPEKLEKLVWNASHTELIKPCKIIPAH